MKTVTFKTHLRTENTPEKAKKEQENRSNVLHSYGALWCAMTQLIKTLSWILEKTQCDRKALKPFPWGSDSSVSVPLQ